MVPWIASRIIKPTNREKYELSSFKCNSSSYSLIITLQFTSYSLLKHSICFSFEKCKPNKQFDNPTFFPILPSFFLSFWCHVYPTLFPHTRTQWVPLYHCLNLIIPAVSYTHVPKSASHVFLVYIADDIHF